MKCIATWMGALALLAGAACDTTDRGTGKKPDRPYGQEAAKPSMDRNGDGQPVPMGGSIIEAEYGIERKAAGDAAKRAFETLHLISAGEDEQANWVRYDARTEEDSIPVSIRLEFHDLHAKATFTVGVEDNHANRTLVRRLKEEFDKALAERRP